MALLFLLLFQLQPWDKVNLVSKGKLELEGTLIKEVRPARWPKKKLGVLTPNLYSRERG